MSFFNPPKEFIIYETEYWTVNHRLTTCLPGYLMVSTKISDTLNFEEYPFEAKQELGLVLAEVETAVKNLFQPERIYIGRYGHSPGHLMHFHIIPVYAWVKELFLQDERYRILEQFNYEQDSVSVGIDGAVLTFFIWREFCDNSNPSLVTQMSVAQAIEVLKKQFNKLNKVG